VLYRHEIFFYGGILEDSGFKGVAKEDVLIYDIGKYYFNITLVKSKFSVHVSTNRSNVKWRRNHVACCIGFYMFMHGGITETGGLLSDMWVLDLNKLKWLEVKANGANIGGLSNHSICVVINKEKLTGNNFNMFKNSDNIMMKSEKIKNEGIYIFGGIDDDSRVTNNLYLLKINRPVLEKEKLNTVGKAPSPRADTSLNFYEDLKVLIVHGGRSESEYFNDTFILDIISLNWYKVKLFEEGIFNNKTKLLKRCGHGAVIVKDNLIIFGGNNDIFVGSEMFMLNLNLTKKNDFLSRTLN
jgi:hypothetical protein